MKLTVAEVERKKHSGTKGPDKYYDQHGLVLRVMPKGSKQWLWFGKNVDGERTSYGLGGYPVVTLREARELALDYKRKARKGIDPRPKKEKKNIPTFEISAAQCFEFQRRAMKPNTARAWLSSLRMYAFPTIGEIRVDKITGQDVMDCLSPIWSGKNRTARSVRQRIGVVMKWSIAQGIRTDNPAGDALAAVLPKNGETHHREAMPYRDIPAAFQAMRHSGPDPMALLALEFTVLTMVRGGATCAARWDEIDFEGKVWTIPAMKKKKGLAGPLAKKGNQAFT